MYKLLQRKTIEMIQYYYSLPKLLTLHNDHLAANNLVHNYSTL
ncbi:hypothetical protein HMPREF0497_2558 [Lentilactobacillus buchneri ATCC 11577]|uniref:Uncharacterized protein n=1 Tax=Lentilactobacillus hilgardii (strain ATCC 8290 / DSM 20176 / CCUG 30140 / JCM 1155 / KCTC 3500 / NBRC 15886 / NCIMB 8040 / NRRL B-1843 / 9) TaxID=1423757 RepID=C0XM26_LENH9|nr:hypothetical protein HMPREF0497_2558 [Lentilactobacillus buchneri ATCC 11577]EEI23565.1 hypothetical protein HMPREF0519_2287 [Lentilactobacillus hilgardii DSM 20176 = ATCC 8290]